MNRQLFCLASLVLLAMSLVGCGNYGASTPTKPPSPSNRFVYVVNSFDSSVSNAALDVDGQLHHKGDQLTGGAIPISAAGPRNNKLGVNASPSLTSNDP